MIYIEIENTKTGATLRIPDTFFYVEETFENSVEDVTWEDWTRPVEMKLDDLEPNALPNHFLFGAWEVLAQNNSWGTAITTVMKEEKFGEIVDSEKIVVRSGRE